MPDHPIHQQRKKLGLTQEALAAEAKIDVRTVRRAESGERMSAETLKALAHALAVDITTLTQAAHGPETTGPIAAPSAGGAPIGDP